MKNYLITGRNIDIDVSKLQAVYEKNDNSLVIHGNKKNLLDCNEVKLPNNARVIINADGFNTESGHILDLCSNSQDTSMALQTIAAKHIVNFELLSCYGGAAINAIKKLATGSTLITMVDSKYTLSSSLQQEISLKIASLTKSDNPFIQFMHYLLFNPDSNKFAIKTENGSKTFTSSIEDLQSYSVIEVKAWQKKQLSSFIKFCQGIKDTLPKASKMQLDEAADLLENKAPLLEKFDTARYRELLFINMARSNNLQAMDKLLESEVDIESSLIDGSTALYIAANMGSFKAVQLLCKKGAKLEAAIDEGATPLWVAAQAGHLEIVKFLWKKGAKLDVIDYEGATSLWVATQEGHLDVVKFLWSKNVDLNLTDHKGATPLLIATQMGNFDLIKFLLSKNAQLDIADQKGATPLLIAVQEGYFDIVEYLWSKGVKLDIADNKGITPLFMAAQLGHADIAKFLASKGVEIDGRNNDGATPLFIGSQEGRTDIIKILIKAHANLEIKISGMTALLIAVNRGHIEIVKLLLAAGANSNEKYQDKKILNWSNSSEISNEIKLFNKSPIKYILKANNNTELALASFKRLETLPNIKQALIEKVHKTEECLEAQDKYMDLDLNSLCGENGTWYNNEL